MTGSTSEAYVSRGGDKLAAALDHFQFNVDGCLCADLGSHVGGFVDCLLQRGASRVYSVDTSYGTLAWTLRRDSRVVVLERTNAMHVALPEPAELITIDVGWTRQSKILPNARKLIQSRSLHTGSPDTGVVITLIKPHYEAKKEMLEDGVLLEEHRGAVIDSVLQGMESTGWSIRGTFDCPIAGHGGNREVFALLQPA